MVTQHKSSLLHIVRVASLLLIGIFLLLAIVACGTEKQGVPVSTGPLGPPVLSPLPVTPTPILPPAALHGPTNFLLSNQLSFTEASGTTTDNSGAVTQLDAGTIQASISSELKRILFVADKNNVVKVYTPGATSPISTEVTQQSDGSTAIQYTQVASSTTTTFDSILSHDLITVGYRQQYSGSVTANDPLSMISSDVTVAFTTHVQWVAPDQIPTAPEHGVYQLTADGGVVLSWSAGQHSKGYNVYRLVPGVDQQFQLLSTVTGTTYSDESAIATKNARTASGIAYAIFAVGPTNVENPSDALVTVAGQ